MGKTKKEKIVKKQWAIDEESDINGEEPVNYDDLEGQNPKKKTNQDNVIFCRVCGYGFDDTTGQPILLICDNCSKDFNIDKIWEDINNNLISEEEMESFDLEKYKL